MNNKVKFSTGSMFSLNSVFDLSFHAFSHRKLQIGFDSFFKTFQLQQFFLVVGISFGRLYDAAEF